MSTHRMGVNPGFLTKHSLRLSTTDSEAVQQVVSEIDQLPGIDAVGFNVGKRKLKVAYDGSVQDIDGILAIVEKNGLALKPGRWNRWRLNLQRQTDQNIKENAKHEAHCCSKMPPGFNTRH